VLLEAWTSRQPSGIVNLGSGSPLSHRDVAELAVQGAQETGVSLQGGGIELVDMPAELRDSFQFKTCAEEIPAWIQKHTTGTRTKMLEYMRALMRGSLASATKPKEPRDP
jgi:ADP-L-glycero-D-manno-heptose 6-epimerase